MILTFPATLKKRTAPHAHQVHELVAGAEGIARLIANGHSHEISRNHFVMVPAGMTHYYEPEGRRHATRMTIVCFGGPALERSLLTPPLQATLDHMLRKEATSIALHDDAAEETAALLQMLRKALEREAPHSRDKAGAVLAAILINLLTAAEAPVRHSQSARLDEIQKIVTWISDHPAEEITIERAARRAHMSRSVFTRHFREHTNTTFCQYVNNARLTHAARLLLRESLPIGEAAYQSGFRNLGHFYARFQQRYGMTPNQYRKVSLEPAG